MLNPYQIYKYVSFHNYICHIHKYFKFCKIQQLFIKILQYNLFPIKMTMLCSHVKIIYESHIYYCSSWFVYENIIFYKQKAPLKTTNEYCNYVQFFIIVF